MANGNEPWHNWIPGVLDKNQVEKLVGEYIGGIDDPNSSVEESSIDLHLTEEAWRLTRGSVKPTGGHYQAELDSAKLIEPLKSDDKGEFHLEAKQTYLFKLKEFLRPPKHGWEVHGQATAKSTVGRVDVLARLIVDGMDYYEGFEPGKIAKGGAAVMYVEITPITFNVRVRAGISLNQLRLFYGTPEDSVVRGHEIISSVITNADETNNKGSLAIDLDTSPGFDQKIIAFRAKSQKTDFLPLWETNKLDGVPKPNAEEFWDVIEPNPDRRLLIEKNHFYIMRSKERIAVPPGIAVYCKAVDETIGEMRIHYAGFAHPYFGYERKDGKTGTPLVFEVRGHDVNVNLKDEEILANLVFFRMSMDSKKSKEPSYSDQELQLSKIFSKWPRND